MRGWEGWRGKGVCVILRQNVEKRDNARVNRRRWCLVTAAVTERQSFSLPFVMCIGEILSERRSLL